MPNPTIPAWVPPLDTGQTSALDLNDLGSLPKANFAAANQIIPITYGRDRLFGQPFVVHVDEDAGHLYLAYSFCEGQIAGFEKIIIDGDDALTTGKAYVGLKNRGFESGDTTYWVLPASGTISSTEARTGTYSAHIPSLAGGPNLISTGDLCPPEGTKMRLTGYMMRDELDLPDASANMAMRWYEADGTPVGGRDLGTVPTDFTNLADDTVAGWQECVTTVTVPALAALYSVDFGESIGTTGFWYCDDAKTEILADDDTSISVDGMELVAYVGTQTQFADSLLTTPLPGYADALPGLAYIVARVPKDATRGFPRLEAIVQGRLVYDPRKDTTAGGNSPEVTFTRTTIAGFRDWEGLYREAAIDEPRFDGARRVENLQLYSEEMGDATYTRSNCTSTDNATIAPDGTLTADHIVSALVTGRIGVTIPALTVVANEEYTHSVYLKAAEWTLATLFFDSATALPSAFYGSSSTVDLIAGTADVDYITMTDAGDGWWRCSITGGDSTTAMVCNVVIQDPTNPGVNAVIGDGVSGLYMWGRQIELVSGQADQTPSEYQSTVAATVARTYNTNRQGHVLVGSRAITNEALWSQDFSNAAWLQPLSAVTVTTGILDPLNGTNAQRLESGGVDGVIRQVDLHPAGTAVTNSLWIRRVSGSGAVELYEGDGTLRTDVSAELTTDWQLFFASGIATGSDSFGLNVAVSGDIVEVAFFQTEVASPYDLGPGQYQATTTVAVTSEPYTVDRNGEDLPGGRGLMIEPDRTNIALQSEDLSTTHVLGVALVDTDATTAPDGSPTADRLKDANGGGTSSDVSIRTQGELVPSGDNTYSCFAKADGLDWMDMRTFSFDASADGETYFDLANGVLGTVSANHDSAGMEYWGNGWYRCWITFNTTGDLNGFLYTYVAEADGDRAVDADDTSSIFLWGQQCEAGDAPSSYIPTTTTSEDRTEDYAVATNVDWLNTGKGSLVFRGVKSDALLNGMLFSIDDGTSDNRIQALSNSGSARSFLSAAAATQVDQSTGTILNDIPFGYAISWALDDFSHAFNGIAGASDAAMTVPTGLDRIVFGGRTTGNLPWTGFVSELVYYDVQQGSDWLLEVSKQRAPTLAEPSITLSQNFARDMTLAGEGAVGGFGTHRIDDVTTWEFSQNPTICFRDTVHNYTGWDILDAGVVDNANSNDEIISGVPRRQIGLTLAKANTVASWMGGWRTYMGAFLNWESGKIRVIPNRPDVEAPGAVVGDGTAGCEVSMGDVLDFIATDDFTVELKYKSVGSGLKVMMSKKDSIADNSAGYSLHISDAVLQATISDGVASANDQITLAAHDNTWRHAAFTVDRTLDELEVFSEGISSGSATDITSIGSLSGAEVFRLMSDQAGNVWDGSIDEVRVWSVKRTPAQILDNKDSEITDPENDATLVGYWKLNEATSATMAPDESGSGNDGTLAGTAVFGTGDAQVIPDGVVMHIGVDDILMDSMKLERRSLRSVPNSVAIDYEDSSGTRWFTARTQADSVRVTNDLEARRLSRVSLPGIHNASQAQREATERLNWYLTDLECRLTLFDEGWNLTHGSIVAVTHPIGLDAKLFRVRQTTAKSGRWTVDLVEYDPAIYSDSVVSDPTIPDTNLGDPLNPPTVTNLVLAEELFNYKTGTTGSRVRITFDATNFPFLSQYLVEGYVGGAKVWQTTTAANDIITPGVEEIVDTIGTPTDYEVRVYVQSPFASGTPAIDNVQIDGKFAIPGDPTGATIVQTFADEIDLTWVAAVDIDIWRYEVRRGTTSDTWATALSLGFIDGLTFTDTGLALGTHRYFIKAIDSVKQESANAAEVDVTLSAPAAVSGLFGFEVASEVRLNWLAVSGGFVERYRIAYSDIPETFETTLDIVDTIRFQTKDVPEGTFTFKAYSVDKAGNEAATAATIEIEVTSDADAFLADTYEFSFRPDTEPDIVANGSLTNMVEWDIRTDNLAYYVTNMGDVFAVTPTDFVAADPLANYHSTGASEWLSETKDFGLLLTGSWNLTHDTVALQGNIEVALELSTDDVTYVSFGGSSKGEYRYARVRITTVASPGTATSFVKTPVMSLKINVVPLEESGSSTSSPVAGTGATINLSREYTALKEITTQPKNTIASGSAVTSIVDTIIIGPNTTIQAIGTEYYAGGDWSELDFAGDFTAEYITKHTGSSGVNQLMFGKRNGSLAGWTVYHDYNTNEVDFRIDDGTNQVNMVTTGNALPDDGEQHHVAIVVDRTGDTVNIYVDSVLTGGSPFDISSVTGSLASAVNFNIFATNSGSSVHEVGGQLDQLRIWNITKSQPDILASYDIALDMTQTQTGLVHYQLCDGDIGTATGPITDVTTNARTLTNTGAGDNTYVDPGNTGPNVQKINSFDVFIFDTFGQQLAEQFQWKWKAV